MNGLNHYRQPHALFSNGTAHLKILQVTKELRGARPELEITETSVRAELPLPRR